MKTMSQLNNMRDKLKEKNRGSNVFQNLNSPNNNDVSMIAKVKSYKNSNKTAIRPKH